MRALPPAHVPVPPGPRSGNPNIGAGDEISPPTARTRRPGLVGYRKLLTDSRAFAATSPSPTETITAYVDDGGVARARVPTGPSTAHDADLVDPLTLEPGLRVDETDVPGDVATTNPTSTMSPNRSSSADSQPSLEEWEFPSSNVAALDKVANELMNASLDQSEPPAGAQGSPAPGFTLAGKQRDWSIAQLLKAGVSRWDSLPNLLAVPKPIERTLSAEDFASRPVVYDAKARPLPPPDPVRANGDIGITFGVLTGAGTAQSLEVHLGPRLRRL